MIGGYEEVQPERYLSKVSGVLVLVQRAIDLYMGLGQGKLRAMELNLCLEHLKREWKLVPGNGRDLEKEGTLAWN